MIVVFAVSYADRGESAPLNMGAAGIAVDVIEILLEAAALALAAGRQWRRRDRPRTSSGVAKKFTARLKQLKPWKQPASGCSSSRGPSIAAAAVVLVRSPCGGVLRRRVQAFLAFALLLDGHQIGLIFLYFKPGVPGRPKRTWPT